MSSRVVRDAASEVPPSYSPPDLFTGALQHTDPSLTWDETDKRRKKVCVEGCVAVCHERVGEGMVRKWV